MGNPRNYSLDLPQRCLQLLEELWPHAEKIYQTGRHDLGPMTSTFLLSMSMPIITLPIERIDRSQGDEANRYISDRAIDPKATEAFGKVQHGLLGKAPFFVKDTWHFVSYGMPPFPDISEAFPDHLVEELASARAARDAEKMTVQRWSSILRNALAHGGIAYLNEHGASSNEERVKKYAFISVKSEKDSKQCPPPLKAVNFLRISEKDYRDFLRRWVDWLRKIGIEE